MAYITPLTAPGSLSSPSTATQKKTFTDNYGVIVGLPKAQQMAVAVQSLIDQAKSGSLLTKDYSAIHSTLVQDAITFFHGIEKMDHFAFKCSTDWAGAKNSDGTLTTDIPTLIAAVPDIISLPEDTVMRVLAYLRICIGT